MIVPGDHVRPSIVLASAFPRITGIVISVIDAPQSLRPPKATILWNRAFGSSSDRITIEYTFHLRKVESNV